MASKYCFKNICSPKRLADEIVASGIATAIDHIDVNTDTSEIWFVSELSLEDQIKLNKIFLNHVGTPVKNSAFADKVLPNGKKIYTRIHGISAEVQNSMDIIDFTVPYASCKITGIEIFGAKLGDIASFKVIDTAEGTYSGQANYVLNQFGFNINIAKDEWRYKSDYDADLYQGMKLRIEYDALDEILPRDVYINLILHEVKD